MTVDRSRATAMRSIARHPVLFAILFGLSIGAYTDMVGAPLWVGILVGAGLCLTVLALYLPKWGLGRRWVDSLPDNDSKSH